MKILIADDERPLLNFLQRGLSAEGLEVVAESGVMNLISRIEREQPQVVVLDRMFGEDDSLGLLSHIKRLPVPPKVLLLSALDDVVERVAGLREGADDYLCKPFDFDELLARIHVLGRRHGPQQGVASRRLCCGSVSLDTEQRLAYWQEEELSLTRLEFDLLLYLLENPGRVLSRERILSRVWQSYRDPQTNIVDVYISRLRQRLADVDDLVIETLRGSGYRLQVDNR
jgi:DNA-binding response OmpR family regulator